MQRLPAMSDLDDAAAARREGTLRLRRKLGLRVLRGTQDLANCVARQPQVASDLPDRPALDKVFAPYSTDRLHNQHLPPPASRQSRQPINRKSGGQFWTP